MLDEDLAHENHLTAARAQLVGGALPEINPVRIIVVEYGNPLDAQSIAQILCCNAGLGSIVGIHAEKVADATLGQRHLACRRCDDDDGQILVDGQADTGLTTVKMADHAQDRATVVAQRQQRAEERDPMAETVGAVDGIYDPLVLGSCRGFGTLFTEDAMIGKGRAKPRPGKVFHREVAGLVEKVAREVAVTVYPGQGVEMIGLTGFDGRPPAGPVQITMQELGTGDGQVLLTRLQVSPGRGRERLVAAVTLDYFDVFAQRLEQVMQEVTARTGAGADYDPLWDLEILRNATIQRTAEGLKEIDQLYDVRRYEDAWKLAYDLEQALREVARLTNDEAMVKDAELMQRYQSVLAEQIRYEGGRVPQPASEEGTLRPYRGRTAPPTPSVPVLEVN